MNKTLLKVFGIILGVATIALAIAVFSQGVGYYENNISYGGDAYTGIQNAAAQSANNVKYVGEMIRFALGSQMLVMGLAMLLGSLCIRTKVAEEDAEAICEAEPEEKEEKQPAPAPLPFGKPNLSSHLTDEAGEWKCTRCGTVNESVGIYCHVCGKAKD